jgi:hypothetical protein
MSIDKRKQLEVVVGCEAMYRMSKNSPGYVVLMKKSYQRKRTFGPDTYYLSYVFLFDS